jgi:archaeal flagellar protein FlaF
MAFADLIGAAVGIMLLVIVAYLLVGSTISTAEIVTNAQKAAALQDQVQLRTGFTISDAYADQYTINCTVKNTGSEIISDFTHMDFIVYDRNTTAGYTLYRYSNGVNAGTWTIIDKGGEVIHLSELDPGESYKLEVTTYGTDPQWFQITTGNGIYASKLLKE